MVEPLQLEEFILRPLTLGDDLSSYLSWIRDPQKFPYIQSARQTYSIVELREYIQGINLSSDAVQYGVFTRQAMHHIGNIKFHDFSREEESCFVGFLIGNEAFQNKGLVSQFFLACARQLNELVGIRSFLLSVNENHTQAIRAYEKIGFVSIPKTLSHLNDDSIRMKFEISG
jgi:RimJ/RimL family protein N-acetyltransferase